MLMVDVEALPSDLEIFQQYNIIMHGILMVYLPSSNRPKVEKT